MAGQHKGRSGTRQRIDRPQITAYHGPRGLAVGGVAERSNAADCKSALFGVRWFESNYLNHSSGRWNEVMDRQATRPWPGGCSSMVELQPSKLATWVRFPSPAPTPTGIVSKP